MTIKKEGGVVMNIADRIQSLRKGKGISQEEQADKIGVTRQPVSKWESEQSLPDIEKIILLSEYFDVTTDYLLRGIEPVADQPKRKMDARIFSVIGTVINFIGFITAILVWIEKRIPSSVAIGLIIMAIGCMIFVIGQFLGDQKKEAAYQFGLVNIWLLSLMPISCVFNGVQGIKEGHWWSFAPIPQLGNSITTYEFCWLIYMALGIIVDIVIIKHILKHKKR